MIIMCLMSKEVTLTTPSQIANNSASRAVTRPAGALDDDTCSPTTYILGVSQGGVNRSIL